MDNKEAKESLNNLFGLIRREDLKNAFKSWKVMDDYYHDTDCDNIPFTEAFDLIDEHQV